MTQTAPISWHAPRDVLELTELVATGALDALPMALDIPVEVALEARSGASLLVEDAEGTAVVQLHPNQSAAGYGVEPLRPFAHSPLRSLRQPPASVVASLGPAAGQAATAVISRGLSDAEVQKAAASPLWLVLIGHGRRHDLPADALVRACQQAASSDTLVVPVAVPLLPESMDADTLRMIAAAHGAGEVQLFTSPAADEQSSSSLHQAFAAELQRSVPGPAQRGVTVFFTGLSGSGKSTVAKALADRIEVDGRRGLSMLDGDEVRRLLSAGLSFSRSDRDLNIRRIGYVAYEVTRHGGLAICAPIAPFAQVRDEVGRQIAEVGDFVLVHISTSLEECERRDRKGLYAKARRGEIPDFTGISSPYETPTNADLVIDTEQHSVEAAVDLVFGLLSERGYFGA